MNDECTVLQFGRRYPMHEPIQSLMPLAMAAPAPVVLDEGRRAIRLGLLVLALAFGGAGLMLGRVPLASAVVAPGVVKVADNRKSVQHLEGGIVKEIRVRNGDRVAAGQTLILLEDERASAGLDLLAGQWDTAAARAARASSTRFCVPAPACVSSFAAAASPSAMIRRACDSAVSASVISPFSRSTAPSASAIASRRAFSVAASTASIAATLRTGAPL
jgi:multidrug efflux pump subunit AcrA (membrane-fusion protein)